MLVLGASNTRAQHFDSLEYERYRIEDSVRRIIPTITYSGYFGLNGGGGYVAGWELGGGVTYRAGTNIHLRIRTSLEFNQMVPDEDQINPSSSVTVLKVPIELVSASGFHGNRLFYLFAGPQLLQTIASNWETDAPPNYRSTSIGASFGAAVGLHLIWLELGVAFRRYDDASISGKLIVGF